MILVVGNLNINTIFDVDNIITDGLPVLAAKVIHVCGGKGANQAIAASKLGSDVVILGCVGNDLDGQQLVKTLGKSGVNTDYLIRSDNVNTATSYYAVQNGEEKYLRSDCSANMMVTPEYLLANEDLFKAADYCILQLEIPAETVKKVITLCQLHRVKVIFNPSPLKRLDLSTIKGSEYVVGSDSELAYIVGIDSLRNMDADSVAYFMKRYAIRNMIALMGTEGVYHYDVLGNLTRFPICPSDTCNLNVFNDTFVGTFASSLSSNADIKEAIEKACIATKG